MSPNEPIDNSLDFMLPVPDRAQQSEGSADSNPAADLVRLKVQQAYGSEPNAATETLDVAELGTGVPRSRHQQFIYDLTTSGGSLPEIQTAWHEYYAGLLDAEKHKVWEEFYDAHARASKFASAAPVLAPKTSAGPITLPDEPPIPRKTSKQSGIVGRTVADLRDYVLGGVSKPTKLKPVQHLQSILFGLAIGSIVLLIFLFGFFNERFIAPFIQPSRTITNTPIISDSTATGTDPEIIIPKINVEIPVVYGMKSIKETDVNQALENGVLSYADSAVPGEKGNGVIVGHSSNNIFNKGKYKFAFVLLNRLAIGDTFYLDKDGKRYTYQVYERKIVKPSDVSVLGPKDKPATVTLITCDPPGTAINRLVVIGEQISPDPVSNIARDESNELATQTAIIPSNAPSLWSKVMGWLPF